MSSWDGTELFYRAWWPEGKKAKKALLLFHRGHEHSGRWQETVDSLGLDDVAVEACFPAPRAIVLLAPSRERDDEYVAAR